MRRTALLLCTTLLLAGAGCDRPVPGPPATAPSETSVAVDPTAAWPEGREFESTSVTESGADRPLVAGTRLTVRFRAPGELEVRAGCNYLGVRGHLEGARLVPDSLLSTAIGCESERLAQDRWIVDFFNAGPTWQLRGDELTLRAGTTEIVLAPARPVPAGSPS
jgi:heat shock protein HslJ